MQQLIAKLRLEVAEMERTLDSLWQRSCPRCLHPLTKSGPDEKWKCGNCGWEE